jgi:hypothetical protein
MPQAVRSGSRDGLSALSIDRGASCPPPTPARAPDGALACASTLRSRTRSMRAARPSAPPIPADVPPSPTSSGRPLLATRVVGSPRGSDASVTAERRAAYCAESTTLSVPPTSIRITARIFFLLPLISRKRQ